MDNWKKYYERTTSKSPSKIIMRYFQMKLENNNTNKKAIDLGCGSGNDTIYLLKNNYFVTAVDKEESIVDIIKSRISDTSKLDFVIENFENVKLNEADLIVANFSLYFCNPKYFKKFWNEITQNITPGGYFVGNFMGKEDEWSKDNNRTFVDKEELMEMFKGFKIVYFDEKKFNKKTVKGDMKFWHVFEIIAKKN